MYLNPPPSSFVREGGQSEFLYLGWKNGAYQAVNKHQTDVGILNPVRMIDDGELEVSLRFQCLGLGVVLDPDARWFGVRDTVQ